jgi:hypothetical protein
MASYTNVSSEHAIELWMASVAADWLKKWTFMDCIIKLL